MELVILRDRNVNILKDGPQSSIPSLTINHPVEEIQNRRNRLPTEVSRQGLANVFGVHMPMRLALEEHIFSRPHRIAGLVSDSPAYEIATGTHTDFGFEDYLNDPRYTTEVEDIHTQMEERLGIRI